MLFQQRAPDVCLGPCVLIIRQARDRAKPFRVSGPFFQTPNAVLPPSSVDTFLHSHCIFLHPMHSNPAIKVGDPSTPSCWLGIPH